MPRPKGSPNKITAEIKERLSQVIMDAMSSIDYLRILFMTLYQMI